MDDLQLFPGLQVTAFDSLLQEMPIDINATQWGKDSGLEERLLSQLKKKGVLEGVCGTVVAHDRGETTMVEMVVRKDHGSIFSDDCQTVTNEHRVEEVEGGFVLPTRPRVAMNCKGPWS